MLDIQLFTSETGFGFRLRKLCFPPSDPKCGLPQSICMDKSSNTLLETYKLSLWFVYYSHIWKY